MDDMDVDINNKDPLKEKQALMADRGSELVELSLDQMTVSTIVQCSGCSAIVKKKLISSNLYFSLTADIVLQEQTIL